MDNYYSTLIFQAKELFQKRIEQFGSDPYSLIQHVIEAEKWANYILKSDTSVDERVIFLTLWLHDIGHYPIIENKDHAVLSTEIAKDFLIKNKCPSDILENTLHCIRTHRCKDKFPESSEAKLFVVIDSASHITDTLYLEMVRDDRINKVPFRALNKLERDIRDISSAPDLLMQLQPLINAWKNLIQEFDKIPVK